MNRIPSIVLGIVVFSSARPTSPSQQHRDCNGRSGYLRQWSSERRSAILSPPICWTFRTWAACTGDSETGQLRSQQAGKQVLSLSVGDTLLTNMDKAESAREETRKGLSGAESLKRRAQLRVSLHSLPDPTFAHTHTPLRPASG